MTISASSAKQLEHQASQIAQYLHKASNGTVTPQWPVSKLILALAKTSIEIGIVMDDKVVKIALPWAKIREHTEPELAAYIVKYMQDREQTIQ